MCCGFTQRSYIIGDFRIFRNQEEVSGGQGNGLTRMCIRQFTSSYLDQALEPNQYSGYIELRKLRHRGSSFLYSRGLMHVILGPNAAEPQVQCGLVS